MCCALWSAECCVLCVCVSVCVFCVCVFTVCMCVCSLAVCQHTCGCLCVVAMDTCGSAYMHVLMCAIAWLETQMRTHDDDYEAGSGGQSKARRAKHTTHTHDTAYSIQHMRNCMCCDCLYPHMSCMYLIAVIVKRQQNRVTARMHCSVLSAMKVCC